MIVLHLLLLVLLVYLGLNVLYLLLFSIAGLFRKQPEYLPIADKKRFIILIPAYKEDGVILNTVKQAVAHDYPPEYFDVMVIADQLKTETLQELEQFPIKVLEVFFKNSTKAKAIKSAIELLPEDYYDFIMILDADNLLGEGCLEKANAAFHSGFDMVQLHRTAKNRNTPTAILDAISEEINNHIFRQGHRALGLSPTLIGSGMAFRYADFEYLMTHSDIENNPGEDREINLEFLKRGKVGEYIADAFVYDEKVQSRQVFEKQRTRWMSAQLQYLRKFWIDEFRQTVSCNIYYLNNALQTLLLPRVLLLALSFIIMIADLSFYFFTSQDLFPGSILWVCLFLGSVASLGISVFPYISQKEAMVALRNLPVTFYAFFKALLKSKSNQQKFIHTPKEFIGE